MWLHVLERIAFFGIFGGIGLFGLWAFFRIPPWKDLEYVPPTRRDIPQTPVELWGAPNYGRCPSGRWVLRDQNDR